MAETKDTDSEEDNVSFETTGDDELSHFTNRPLCQSTLNDATFKRVAMSRTLTHNGRGHTLTGKTWHTPDTIAHLISFYRSPKSDSESLNTDPTTRPEVRRFYDLGAGLNAHPDLLHGGVISVLLDSSLGGAVGMLMLESRERRSYFTVQLNVKYEKPVRTPNVIMVRAWVVKLVDGGRKVWAEGVVEGDDGVVHARAEGMWVRAKPRKEKM